MSDVLLDTAVAIGARASPPTALTPVTTPESLVRSNTGMTGARRGAPVPRATRIGEVALAEDVDEVPVSTSRAATYFHFGKFMFVHDMDQAKDAHTRHGRAQRATPCSCAGKSTRDPFEIPNSSVSFVGPRRWTAPDVLLIPGLDSTKTSSRSGTFLPRPRHGDFRTRRPRQGERNGRCPFDRSGGRRRDRHWVSPIDARRGLESNRRLGSVLGGFYAARLASANLPVRRRSRSPAPTTWAPPGRLKSTYRHAFEVRSYSRRPRPPSVGPGHDA